MRDFLGLHAPVQGATDSFKRSCLMLGVSNILWTAAEGPQDTQPGWTNLVRLPTPQKGESGEAYVARTRGQIQAWYTSGIPAIFIPGNEPDLAESSGDVPVAYGRDEWEAQIGAVIPVLRRTWNAIQLAAPAYSVGNTTWVRGQYLAPFDAACAHAYWPADQPHLMTDPGWGGAWQYVSAYGKAVYITEANSNPVTPTQIADWLRTLDTHIQGVCLYITDDLGHDPAYNITPEIAGQISAAYAQPQSPPVPEEAPPPPPPASPPPPPVEHSDGTFDPQEYAYAPLSRDQYHQIIQGALYPGVTSSPMDTDANFTALLQQSRARDKDLRLFLAFTWEEGHDGTDPGLAAASANNLGGIKWRGQADAFDSGIPTSEGDGDYAGYPDLGLFFDGWADTMENDLIGPYFRSGDLYSAARKYVNWNDPNAGHGRIDKWREYRTQYPPDGATASENDPATPSMGVTGAMLIAKLRTMIGQPYSNGIDGQAPPNTFHPWAFWCEALAEAIPRSFGLPIPRIDSAVNHGRLLQSQGRLVQGRPQHGAWGIFDETFGKDGHITFWDDEVGMFLGTLTDGTGIGYHANWDWTTPGYMGSCLPDGVGVMEDLMRHDGKADEGALEWMWKFRTDIETGQPIVLNPMSGIFQGWRADLMAGKPWGVPQTNEHDLGDRILQMFSSGVATYVKATGEVFFN